MKENANITLERVLNINRELWKNGSAHGNRDIWIKNFLLAMRVLRARIIYLNTPHNVCEALSRTDIKFPKKIFFILT